MNWRKRVEPFVRPVFHLWWRLNRGMTLGVRVIARRSDGHVALVKHTYIKGWHLPGGGVDAGETAPVAAIRELREEVGLLAQSPARLLAVFSNHKVFKGDHVLLFEVTSWSEGQTDNHGEIEEVGWFDPAALPEAATPATRRRLQEYLAGAEHPENW